MVQLNHVETQLKDIGCNFRFFGRPEVRELAKIIMPGEIIAHAVNGYYEGGFALLVVTDQRLLLIDRKPMFLTIEDIRFDMIAEIDFNHRLLNATARIFSMNKSLVFTTWNHARLRVLIENLQHRVMQLRTSSHHIPAVQQQFSQSSTAGTPMMDESDEPMSLAHVALEGATAAPLTICAPKNPYTKMPLLSRRRKFPSFY